MPLSEIERLSIIGGSGDTQDAMGGLLGISPMAVAKVIEALKSSGIDLPAMLNPAAADGRPPIEPVVPNSQTVQPSP
jgi:flotillin